MEVWRSGVDVGTQLSSSEVGRLPRARWLVADVLARHARRSLGCISAAYLRAGVRWPVAVHRVVPLLRGEDTNLRAGRRCCGAVYSEHRVKTSATNTVTTAEYGRAQRRHVSSRARVGVQECILRFWARVHRKVGRAGAAGLGRGAQPAQARGPHPVHVHTEHACSQGTD